MLHLLSEKPKIKWFRNIPGFDDLELQIEDLSNRPSHDLFISHTYDELVAEFTAAWCEMNGGLKDPDTGAWSNITEAEAEFKDNPENYSSRFKQVAMRHNSWRGVRDWRGPVKSVTEEVPVRLGLSAKRLDLVEVPEDIASHIKPGAVVKITRNEAYTTPTFYEVKSRKGTKVYLTTNTQKLREQFSTGPLVKVSLENEPEKFEDGVLKEYRGPFKLTIVEPAPFDQEACKATILQHENLQWVVASYVMGEHHTAYRPGGDVNPTLSGG